MNKILRIIALSFLIGSTFCFYLAMCLAFFSGSYQVLMDFNAYNEGLLEFIVMVVSVPLIFWYVVDYVRGVMYEEV